MAKRNLESMKLLVTVSSSRTNKESCKWARRRQEAYFVRGNGQALGEMEQVI
jgi:hypothetical protein